MKDAIQDKYIIISSESDLEYLLNRIKKNEYFSKEFKFKKRKYFIKLLDSLDIKYENFIQKYYFYDKARSLHISESQFGYIWISTFGLVARNKTTDNKTVNSCCVQYAVLTTLLDKAIEISKSHSVYDVDSFNFGKLSDFTPAIFHHIVFYIEIFCKAYLSVNGLKVPKTHKLSSIYNEFETTMFKNNHNDTLFQVQIVDPMKKIVEYVINIPGDFKEHFIKYDDNPKDTTLIIFQPEKFEETKIMLEICQDFIMDFYLEKDKSYYLKTGLLRRLLDKAKNEEDRNRILNIYGHMEKKN